MWRKAAVSNLPGAGAVFALEIVARILSHIILVSLAPPSSTETPYSESFPAGLERAIFLEACLKPQLSPRSPQSPFKVLQEQGEEGGRGRTKCQVLSTGSVDYYSQLIAWASGQILFSNECKN